MASQSTPAPRTVSADYELVLRHYLDLRAAEARQLARRSDLVHVPCTFCGSVVSGIAFVRDGFTFKVCHACESIFASPRPPQQVLESRAVDSPASVFWRTTLRPRLDLMRDTPSQNLRIVRHALDQLAPTDFVTVVDIGTGDGALLRHLLELQQVESVSGIEPDAELVESARRMGLHLIADRIEDVVDGSVVCDFATCFDLIEHAYDPVRFLRACARVVRPGGYLLVTAPNAQALSLTTLWDRSNSVFPPDHINIPTSSGISRAIEKAGLHVVDVRSEGGGELQALRVAMRSDELAQIPRTIRAFLKMPPVATRALEDSLKAGGMAGRVVCLAQRTDESRRKPNRSDN